MIDLFAEWKQKPKEKPKNVSYTFTLDPDEEVIWRLNIEEGLIKKKIAWTYIITNRRVISGPQQLLLSDIADVLILNSQRTYEGGHKGHTIRSSLRGTGMSYSTTIGGHRGHYVKTGNILFTSPTQHDMTWTNITSPDDIVKLVKSLKKQLPEKK